MENALLKQQNEGHKIYSICTACFFGATIKLVLVILMLRGIYVTIKTRQSNNLNLWILPVSYIHSFQVFIANDN